MSKKIANVVTAEINTLESQGKALHTAWKHIVKAEQKQMTEFDLPLGNLLIALQAEGEGRIAKSRLRDCNLHVICRRRRSDAKVLAENWSELEGMSKRFTSTSALLKAWKAEQKSAEQPKAEQVEAETTKGKTSDVGQAKTGLEDVSATMTPESLAEQVLNMIDASTFDLADFEKAFASMATIVRDEDAPKQEGRLMRSLTSQALCITHGACAVSDCTYVTGKRPMSDKFNGVNMMIEIDGILYDADDYYYWEYLQACLNEMEEA